MGDEPEPYALWQRGVIDWRGAGHFCWVEESPAKSAWAHCLDFFQRVRMGEMPPLDGMRTEAYVRWQKETHVQLISKVQAPRAAAAGELCRSSRCGPMQAYKTQLRQLLADHGWEVVEILIPDDWWADEFWKVQARRNAWGFEIVLTFLVDPMCDAPRKKGHGVWAVSATTDIPADRLSAEGRIGELCMVKGRFDQKLAAFVSALDAYRDVNSP